MDEIDPTWLGAVLAKHHRDNSIAAVLSVTTEPAVGACENYASVIVRAKIKAVLGSGRITTRKVIMKTALKNLEEEVEKELVNTFNLEGIVYSNFLSSFEAIINENALGYNKIWADCLLTSPKLIIFEDLKLSGFTLGPRKTGLDPVHAKLVLQNLARLHSVSLVAVADGVVYPNLLPNYLMTESPVGQNFLKTSLKAMADGIRDSWSSDWSKVEKKIRSLIDDAVPTLTALCKQEHKLSVVNHGDCWVSNMLFKYDDQGTPVDFKFVDFQICHYNSYAWDLAYFFSTSLHPNCLSSHKDSFIEIYCREFARNLQMLGYDISKAPTIDEVKAELTRLLPYSLVVVCCITPIVVNPSDVKLELTDLINDSPKMGLLLEDEEFGKTIKLMLKQFVDLGVI